MKDQTRGERRITLIEQSPLAQGFRSFRRRHRTAVSIASCGGDDIVEPADNTCDWTEPSDNRWLRIVNTGKVSLNSTKPTHGSAVRFLLRLSAKAEHPADLRV